MFELLQGWSALHGSSSPSRWAADHRDVPVVDVLGTPYPRESRQARVSGRLLSIGRTDDFGHVALPVIVASPVARGILSVLHSHDLDKGADLVTTVRIWVQNECAWDATARELGIHRHTLRNRVQLAGHLLGLALNVLRDRLELWAAAMDDHEAALRLG